MLLTTTQAATELGVTRKRVWQLCRAGWLAYQQVGHALLIDSASLAAARKRPKPGRPRRKR